MVNIRFIVEKWDIAQKWGSERALRIGDWENGMDKCMTVEKEVYKGRGYMKKFDKMWGGWSSSCDIT